MILLDAYNPQISPNERPFGAVRSTPIYCPNCGTKFDTWVSGSYAYPAHLSGDTDASRKSIGRFLESECDEGHHSRHIRSIDGEPATAFPSNWTVASAILSHIDFARSHQ